MKQYMKQFKVGDQVRIVRVEEHNTPPSWIGEICTITGVYSPRTPYDYTVSRGYLIKYNIAMYEDELESVSYFKEEDFETI